MELSWLSNGYGVQISYGEARRLPLVEALELRRIRSEYFSAVRSALKRGR